MTLRHLKIFITVCETGGITLAAKKLFLAQPSVSLAIKELEENYGVRLFDRISRRLYITETGKRFLEYASHIVTLFEKMESEIKNWDLIGILRIGSSITVGNYLLPQYIKKFKKQYPKNQIYVKIDNSSVIEQSVMANDIDIGLIEGVVHYPQIVSNRIMYDELVLVCGEKHPLSIKDSINVKELKNLDFILREKGSGSRELFDSMMLLHNLEIEPIGESVSNQAIIHSMYEGFGLSVLPKLIVKDDIDRGLLHQIIINDITLSRELTLIYHQNKYLSKSANEFMKICMS
jgi:DNA-binding transcriptional LysR family regulator